MWSTAQEKAFQLLKKMLIIAPILVPPDWNLIFHVFVDAFDIAIGEVLMQEKEKGWYRPVYYANRMLSKQKEIVQLLKGKLWKWCTL